MKIHSQQLLAQVRKDTEQLIKIAQDAFGSLSEEELYWTPAPDKWSVGECLEHLNITFRSYMPKLVKGIDKAMAKHQTAVETFNTGFFGKIFTDSFRLDEAGNAKRRVKTFKSFDAGKLPERNAQVREDFTQLLKDFMGQIDRAKQVNLNKVRVSSAIGPILRFRLGDLFLFVAVHNDRHIVQAQKVLEAMKEKVAE